MSNKPQNTTPLAKETKPAQVISITSGKGGVGKTHLTVNLGLALVKLGKRVLLIDGDLGLANINLLLNFKPHSSLAEVIYGKKQIKEIIVAHPLGFDVIPAASGIPELTSLSEKEQLALVEAVDQFATNYDYVLIDTAAGIGDNVLYFNAAAEQILVIIDAEPTSMMDAYALVKVISTRCGRKEFSIIVNRTTEAATGKNTFTHFANTCEHFLNLKLNFIGTIAEDDSLVDAVIKQQPYLHLYPSTRASLDITKVAKKVVSQNFNRCPTGGLQFFFRSLLENCSN